MGLLDALTGTKLPSEGTPVCPPDVLLERLLGLNRESAPWRVVDGSAENVDLIAEWKIVDARWYEIFAKAGLKRTFSVYLQLDPAHNELHAQDREFDVTWEAGIPTLALSAHAFRGQTWSFSAGAAYGFTETLAPGEIYRYTFSTDEIKTPIQDAVIACGWTYKGSQFG